MTGLVAVLIGNHSDLLLIIIIVMLIVMMTLMIMMMVGVSVITAIFVW